MAETLDAHQRNMMAMMISIEKRLQTGSDDRERQFFTHTLQYLTTHSGRQVDMEDWMITSYEVVRSWDRVRWVVCFCVFVHIVDFVSGQVFKGRWNRTNVALKVLTVEDGVTPSSVSIRNEIKIWSRIRHPNVLPECMIRMRPLIFVSDWRLIESLRANILDERLFIVMPYLKNGNCRDYLQKHQMVIACKFCTTFPWVWFTSTHIRLYTEIWKGSMSWSMTAPKLSSATLVFPVSKRMPRVVQWE